MSQATHQWWRVTPSEPGVHEPKAVTFAESSEVTRELMHQTQYRYFRTKGEAWQWMEDRLNKRYQAAKKIFDEETAQIEKLKKLRGG